ncbi:MAG: hypothetical protein HRU21_05515 [Pseudomonadales bacterium]|nr:hypothetical protein [Pseudomonadales bacterium]
MKNSAFLLLLTAFISTLFSACVEINFEATATTQTDSNAASGSTLTGQLSDSYIQGLNYIATPSGLNGVTDAFGSFRFQPGDVVTFSLGPITLPELRANQDEIFYDLFDLTGESSDAISPAQAEKATKIALFLQTLDTDGDDSNGIQLPTVTDVANVSSDETVTLGMDDDAFTLSVLFQNVRLNGQNDVVYSNISVNETALANALEKLKQNSGAQQETSLKWTYIDDSFTTFAAALASAYPNGPTAEQENDFIATYQLPSTIFSGQRFSYIPLTIAVQDFENKGLIRGLRPNATFEQDPIYAAQVNNSQPINIPGGFVFSSGNTFVPAIASDAAVGDYQLLDSNNEVITAVNSATEFHALRLNIYQVDIDSTGASDNLIVSQGACDAVEIIRPIQGKTFDATLYSAIIEQYDGDLCSLSNAELLALDVDKVYLGEFLEPELVPQAITLDATNSATVENLLLASSSDCRAIAPSEGVISRCQSGEELFELFELTPGDYNISFSAAADANVRLGVLDVASSSVLDVIDVVNTSTVSGSLSINDNQYIFVSNVSFTEVEYSLELQRQIP